MCLLAAVSVGLSAIAAHREGGEGEVITTWKQNSLIKCMRARVCECECEYECVAPAFLGGGSWGQGLPR